MGPLRIMPLHANGRAIVCAGDVVGPHPMH